MSLGLLFRLGGRNLFRHRRRNLMLLAAIAVAVGGVIVMNSLIRGMQVDLQAAAVANLTGHLKILAPGYLDDPSIERSFPLASDWQPDLDVEGWASRVRVPAVIMSERETRGVQLVGVDPVEESISFLSAASYTGEALTDVNDRRVVVGRALAEQLSTDVGRRLVIITQGIDGKNRESGFRIAGLYDTDGTGLEKTYVFTGRAGLQTLLDADVVTEVSIKLASEPGNWSMVDGLKDVFKGLDVMNWQQLEPQAAAMFAFADAAIYIWFLIMMSALIFGLVNSLITAVMERVREFGMLRAVGMRAGSVIVQVVIESLLIMLAGVVLGIALGAGAILLLGDGIDLSRWAQGTELAGMRSLLVPKLYLPDIVLVAGLSLVMGVLASVYPAWRAVRVKPLEALRR